MQIVVKRIYEGVDAADGLRVLVDRLWPRGITKDQAALDLWVRDLAPSNELRRWYNHDPAKWEEFRQRYFAELDTRPSEVAKLAAQVAVAVKTTLLYSSREEKINNAVALREYLLRTHLQSTNQ